MKDARTHLLFSGLLMAALFSFGHHVAAQAVRTGSAANSIQSSATGPTVQTPPATELRPLPPAVLAHLRERGVREDQVSLVLKPVRASGAATGVLPNRPVAWAHNAQQPVQVASLVKLLTTGAALSRWGAEYGFRTELAGVRQPGSDVIDGPVYLKGSGDPDFQVEDLWVLLRQLRQSGVREIRGPLILDDTVFAHRQQVLINEPEGSFTDDGPYRAYHARPSALLLGHGALGLVLRPQGSGNAVRVESPMAPAGLQIEAQVQGRGGDCVAWKDTLQVDWPQSHQVRVRGAYPVACGEQRLPIRVPDAQAWMGLWFSDLWQQSGGVGPARWQTGRAPAGTPVLQVWRGRDLGMIVRNVNKFSNNVMAQNLMIALTPPGQSSQDAMTRWLAGLGVGASGLVVGNGSGLSRQDRVPPLLLADMLEAYFAAPGYPELLASLPKAGADGTLSRRFGDLPVSAHLKTGRLKNVSGLAGYLRDSRGQVWVWVSVLNGEQLEDRIDIQEYLLKTFVAMLPG